MEFYDRLISNFPTGITVALAYGSGVFKQQHQAATSDNMIDFIFAVEDPLQWHTDNVARHSSHYSFLKYLGVEFICTVQESFGAKMYYNTLVKHSERLIKYGVISVQSLCHELHSWDNLYISGRLQKPVLFIKGRDDPVVAPLLLTNLTNTLRISLLMLPENFTEESLYLTIAGLSYLGDFRMTIGENRNKVYNIVKPNLSHFHKLYYPILQTFESVHISPNSSKIQQDRSPTIKLGYLNKLPERLKAEMTSSSGLDLHQMAEDQKCEDYARNGIGAIVSRSSKSQSLKGILSAGFFKSLLYSSMKLRKMIQGFVK